MGYIDILNDFWERRRDLAINSSDADVYYALLHEANRHYWEQPFTLSTNIACAELQMSRPTFLRARNKLQQLGFIRFEAGQRNVEKAKYFLLNNFTRDETRTFTRPVTRNVTRTFTINKDKDIDKDKEDINIPPIPPTGEGEAKAKKEPPRPTWKTDFELYKLELQKEVVSFLADEAWMAKLQTYYPNVDIAKSIDKAVTTFWGTEAGWQNKKKKHIATINWRNTLNNTLSKKENQVYLPKQNHYERANDQYRQSRQNCLEAILETFGGNIQ